MTEVCLRTDAGPAMSEPNDIAALDDIVADPDVGTWIRELVNCERGAVLRYDGVVPYNLAVVNETVNFALVDELGAPSALIESVDPVIRSWAVSTLDATGTGV